MQCYETYDHQKSKMVVAPRGRDQIRLVRLVHLVPIRLVHLVAMGLAAAILVEMLLEVAMLPVAAILVLAPTNVLVLFRFSVAPETIRQYA